MPRTTNTHPLTAGLLDGGAGRDQAIRKIRAALKEADGRIVVAAEALGMNRMTLFRLVANAGLNEEAADMRAKAGMPGPRGEPEGRKLSRRRPKKA